MGQDYLTKEVIARENRFFSYGSIRVIRYYLVEVITFILLILYFSAVLIAHNSPAKGYEVSLYEGTPLSFWIAYGFYVFLTILLTILIVRKEKRLQKYSSIPILLFAFAHILVIALPVIRGYEFYSLTDSYIHVGISKDILSYQHLEKTNIYPALHILLAEFSIISNISATKSGQLFPLLIDLFMWLFAFYILSKSVFKDKRNVIFSFIFASSFLLNSLHSMLYPHVLNFYLVFVALGIRINNNLYNQWSGRLLLLLIIFVIPFIHPAPTLLMLIFLVSLEIADKLVGRFYIKSFPLKISFVLPLILFIISFNWYSLFNEFSRIVPNIIENFMNPFEIYHIDKFETEIIGRVNKETLISLFTRLYLDSVLSIVLAALGVFIIIRKILNKNPNFKGFILFALLWLVAAIGEVIIFVSSGSQSIGRIANLSFFVVLSPILAGYIFYDTSSRSRKTISILFQVAFIGLFYTASVLGVFHSKWVFQPSWQLTNSDVLGTHWFVNNKNEEINYGAIGIFPRLTALAEGYQILQSRNDLEQSNKLMATDYGRLVPERLGYQQYSSIGNAVKSDQYLLLSFRFSTIEEQGKDIQWLEVDKQFYTRDITLRDTMLLYKDPSVEKIYTNGEFEVLKIKVNK